MNAESPDTLQTIDLETTGMPKEENNQTRITELSLIAVKRDHVLETRPGASPRVEHKLTLCLNPGRPINPGATKVTGLCNFLLEYEPTFNLQVIQIIDTFLNVLSKPVCLIAQNGLGFDYPILKAHFEKCKFSLADDLCCADCYHAFYDILEGKKKCQGKPDVINVEKTEGTEANDSTPLETQEPSIEDMRLKNETTPKQQAIKRSVMLNKVGKARRKLPYGDSPKPTDSYKLKEIYERVLNRPALEAHRAENDCIMALESSVALNNEFVQWVDENNVLFKDIKPMRIGIPLGD